ncbi:unnamed protein product [Leptosia nina]|uniref:Phosphoenolpyruvate synthase n=1 Tax=Leptosia nina TaxID=320188 RepID=A0AAV1J8H4_9NEOP
MFSDFFYVLFQVILCACAIVIVVISRKTRTKGWSYPFKLLASRPTVQWWKSKLHLSPLRDTPSNQTNGCDAITIRTTAPDGSAVILYIKKLGGETPLAEVHVFVKLADGNTYKLPDESGTSKTAWEDYSNGWSAGGLKVEILEDQDRCRILYNGLMEADGAIQHVKLNLIWASASRSTRYPEDWNNRLAAETLALEPWRNQTWHDLLNKCGGVRRWSQFGAVQGRFQVFDDNGKVVKSDYLRTRGVKERVMTTKGPRRSLTLTVAANDGTIVNLQGLSYENLSQCISGSTRMPDFSLQNVTSCDLILSEFCETSNELPNTYCISVNVGNRCLKLVLRISDYGSRLLSGTKQEYEIIYRVVFAEINGECATGVLELCYERKDKLASPFSLKLKRHLKWREINNIIEPIAYCVEFEDPIASCVEVAGGKGASLALLSSVQKDEGYQVPPGFTITTKALEKHLEQNPDIKNAIKDIELAGVEYEEAVFKEKCNKAVKLFLTKELSGELRGSILKNLSNLRLKAVAYNLEAEPRFAVRSSAVGEDSEALSAAGQNDTVLGISSDEDVLRSVLKCWASMFAFTSAYYRRQNGQPCLCNGAVAVQLLVEPRVAGVMFTRHPEAGDPSRILITANYGLGESVVSGSVEPDTYIIKRSLHGTLSIANLQLGSKTKRIVTKGTGVDCEYTSDGDRSTACLEEDDVLRIARVGARQDELWGAGRDIEFAISKDGTIYLLQARPITSLETWTEEELLHELDLPIMSDDELLSFANTGEVLPKPITPLTHDLVYKLLDRGISNLIPDNHDIYSKSVAMTHNRVAVPLYNSIYRRVPKTIDINLRMLEISIHGHKVADDSTLSTALHRREPKITDKLFSILDMIKYLIISKWRMNDTVERVSKMKIDTDTDSVSDMCKYVTEFDEIAYFRNHSITSAASTFTQFIAMSVLLEGKSDFSPEQCNEIGVMLNSGDVLSAEVPQGLERLAQTLEDSGKDEEFKKLDPKVAMSWLETNLPDVFEQATRFLHEHGHRSIMEFELSTKPWALVPEDLMKVLMHVTPNTNVKQPKTMEEVIASLKTPQKPSTRKALRWILPLCQRAVRYRECTKAHLILAIHKIRLAVIHLGHLMVKNWYLPRHDLVFYFRTHELRKYVETRDPALLKKAIQRQNYYGKWCKLKFSELNTGWVDPLKVEGPKISSDGSVKVAGTSVCGGEVVARACVVRDLSEIDTLRKGDILITHATDIGWSPYFPLLSGIVTELGGLISHGAVIAREYGLPCIVGAVDATSLFQTGDHVCLSSTTGVVEKVKVES